MQYKRPCYIDWFLEKTDEEIKLESGEVVSVFCVNHLNDEVKLNEWAKHIIHHYRTDEQIQRGANINCGGDISKYISDFIVKPTEKKDISGDFGEIVFSDFMEYVLEYEVPRYKKLNTYPSNPTQGIDLFGFKLHQKQSEVIFMEIKARLASKNFKELNIAIAESVNRNDTKKALILENARLFFESHDVVMESKIVSLQSSDNPPIRKSMAGVITSAKNCCTNDFIGVRIDTGKKCNVYALHGAELWELAKSLYERACLWN